MTKYSFKLTVILILVAIGGTYLTSYFWSDNINNLLPVFVRDSLSSSFSYLSQNFFILRKIDDFTSLASENEKLKDENRELLSRILNLDELKEENEHLRKALDLKSADEKIIEAGIFSLNYAVGQHTALLNKGRINSLIKPGDVVITADRILIGTVDEVFDDYSRIILLTDLKFKVTVRVLETGTEGIVNGNLNQGLTMNFVSQNDQISESNLVLSSGNDRLPAGLMIGRIEHLELTPGNVFQDVRIKPSIQDIKLGKVIVIIK